ncbi:hypothetical protein D3C87_814440 [compost metagenome]
MRMKARVRHALAGVGAVQARHVDQVGDHGRGGLLRAGARAVVHRDARRVALDHDAVHRAVHLREQVRRRHQRGLHAQLHALFTSARHAQQLDAKAQLFGAGHVQALQRGDAFDLRIGKADRHAEGIGGQQRGLVGGVDALDVEGRVGLGIAQRLGLRERVAEVQALVAHLAQDEVGGAVDDARHPFDAVGREALAQRFHDGDAHRHRALVHHGHAVRAGGGEDLGAVHGQQRLVGRDHVLAVRDGGQHPVARRAGAASHLDHHVDIGIGGHLHRVGRERHALAHDALGAREVARRHHRHLDAAPGAGGDEVLVAGQHAEGARAHGADADHADAQGANGRRMAGLGQEGRDGIAVHGLLQTTNEQDKNKKTQLPAGFRSFGRRDTRWLPERPPCACSGGRGGHGGNHSCIHCVARSHAGGERHRAADNGGAGCCNGGK